MRTVGSSEKNSLPIRLQGGHLTLQERSRQRIISRRDARRGWGTFLVGNCSPLRTATTPTARTYSSAIRSKLSSEAKLLECYTNTESHMTASNQLVGQDPGKILAAAREILAGNAKKGRVPRLWDGHAAERILEILLREMRGVSAEDTRGGTLRGGQNGL